MKGMEKNMNGMSFDKYIDNPSGEATVITNRNMYKDMYKSKFDKVLLRENGKIDWKVYYTNDANDSFYVYLKIPSEVIENFYYDVVVRLFTTDNKKKSNVKLREYAVEFYSNDPAFVYTFAHSFKKNNLFIKDLESKMSPTALKTVAKTKNPKDNVWYVKSLYFAYLAMERYNLFNRTILKQHGRKYNKRELLAQITHATEKVEARQKAQEKLEKEKREKKKKERPTSDFQSKNSKITGISRTPMVTKTSKTTKTVKKTRLTSMRKP
jgi:hypothetical protein